MIAFLLLTTVVVSLLLVFARWMPVRAARDKMTKELVILVLVSVFAGLGLGSFPPFAAIQRYWFWDNIVPTISEVSASGLEGPQATLLGETLTVEESAPFGYTLQVNYIDGAGKPYFEMVKSHTYPIPKDSKHIRVRWVSGNLVTPWVEINPPTA